MGTRALLAALAAVALIAVALLARAPREAPEAPLRAPAVATDAPPTSGALVEPGGHGRSASPVPAAEEGELAARLRRFAEVELDALRRGQASDEAQAELERLLRPTLTRREELDLVLGHLLARTWAEGDGSRPSTTEFGGVRVLYWGLLLRHSPQSPYADAAAGRALFLALVAALPDLHAGLRPALFDQVLCMRVDGRSLVGLYLADVLALRANFAEHRSLFSALLAVLEDELAPAERDALFGLLLVDEDDPVLVATSLRNLLRGARPDLALALAEELFDAEGADASLRGAIANAVVEGLEDPFQATEFLALRADDLRNEPRAWMALGVREGGFTALEARYRELAELGADPAARRMLVMGMFGAEGGDLARVTAIALEDPHPAVRGQAWLTWTSSPGHRASQQDLVDLRLAREGGVADVHVVGAARNLARGTSGDLRRGAVELLRELALDERVRARDRRAALAALTGHIAEAERLALEQRLAEDLR